jgi:hypothetical protein
MQKTTLQAPEIPRHTDIPAQKRLSEVTCLRQNHYGTVVNRRLTAPSGIEAFSPFVLQMKQNFQHLFQNRERIVHPSQISLKAYIPQVFQDYASILMVNMMNLRHRYAPPLQMTSNSVIG